MEGTTSQTGGERGATRRRIDWNTRRAADIHHAIDSKDRRRLRSIYEDFGILLREEMVEEGGAPVLSIPAVNERIRRRLKTMSGRLALDVGCGPTPVAAISLAEAGFTAVGIDIAHSILRLAETTSEGRVRLAVADGERLPFADASFDVITCDDTLEHALDQRAMASEMARVLRPGGRLLLVSPNAGSVHVILGRARDLLRGKRLPREHYHITDTHTHEARWDEMGRLFRPWLVRRHSEVIGYPERGRKSRMVNRFLHLPGMWRFDSLLFVEFEKLGGRRGPSTVAGFYAGLDEPVSQTSPDVVRSALQEWIGEGSIAGPVLDLGTGVGSNLRLIADVASVIGSEISPTAARRAAALAPVAVADGARLPFADRSFGAVVCTEVLEHVDDPRSVFAEMARVLSPGGVAFVSTPNYANLAGLHKWVADRRSGRHDWNPWGAHHGGFEAFITGRRLYRIAREWFDLVRVRGLDHGQALTGRFRTLDRLAWSAPAQPILRRLIPALHRSSGSIAAWHGMHVTLVLHRRP